MANPRIILTIGHSTRSSREFLDILTAFDVELLVDIRHYPGSKKFPHFGKERLKKNLERRGIDYLHLISLGGRRRPLKHSDLNAGWRSAQFRGYADYMQTREFREGLKELMGLARERLTVIMCAEAVPWRCHRSLVSDALMAHGWKVIDLFNEVTAREHKLTAFAQVYRRKVTYPEA